jgi:dienelactone hydrolase
MPFRRKRWMAIAVAVVFGAGAVVAWPTLATIALLFDLSGLGASGGATSFARAFIPIHPRTVAAERVTIPTRHGPVAARIDRPAGGSDRTIVVLPGIHAAGLDEPRLTRFSTRLAGSGVTVVSVPLPDLRTFRITARSTDVAEDVTTWAASRRDLAPDGRVSLAGVSFAGGLALVAAGRSALSGHLDTVVSLGGHGDLGKVLEFLCTGMLPDGTTRRPHDYSLAVVARTAVPHLVPAAEAAALDRAITLFLQASSDDTPEQTQAKAQLAEAARLRDAMPERSRQIMDWVLTREVPALGAAIQPFIAELASDPSLSPERSPAARVPVFLMQGAGDTVIPPSETPRLAAYLERQGTPAVRWLLTPVLSHVGIDNDVTLGDWWRLVRFWRALQDAIE